MTMFFTRLDKSLRVWFQAVTSNGALRTGITQASFNVNVVNGTDTAQVTAAVSESTQRPGMYYFDVPASFITANGIGDYGVSIVIDTQSGSAGSPHVKTAQSEVVHVTREDFDTISGSIWNAPNGTFNTSGTMGHLVNLIGQVSGNTTPSAIASSVWNAVAANFNTSGTFGWIQNQLFASAAQEVSVASIVSGVWNADTNTFTSPNTFGSHVNEVLRDVKFHMSSTFIASASILSIASSRTWVSTSLSNDTGQFNGMLLMLKSPLSGSQVRTIETFRTGTFDVHPAFSFGTGSDGIYVISTQFVPSLGSIG